MKARAKLHFGARKSKTARALALWRAPQCAPRAPFLGSGLGPCIQNRLESANVKLRLLPHLPGACYFGICRFHVHYRPRGLVGWRVPLARRGRGAPFSNPWRLTGASAAPCTRAPPPPARHGGPQKLPELTQTFWLRAAGGC